MIKSIPIIKTMSILPAEKKNRQLTEKQQKFLDALVVHNGNPKVAAEVAGYSGNYYQVLKSLKDEVINLAEDVLVQHAPRAAFKLVEVMESDKPIAQANNKLQAAQTLLDRVGIAKTDTLNVNHQASNGIFIMPDKKEIIVEATKYEDIPD
tara:strand:+ start:5083 stop:5535 length:453 start_codon:yes stop_codon:yes gene_type:complete